MLETNRSTRNDARIQTIYSGATLAEKFGNPANGRTPDLILQPIAGAIYSGSAAKIAEHGGFADDDTHVPLLLSNPRLEAKSVDREVTNMQVAPTILRALGLRANKLEAVRLEGTRVLPGLELEDD